ncbi:MAG: pentapeptide repeat-containing protein, partial [Cyanobacteriota bacterium]
SAARAESELAETDLTETNLAETNLAETNLAESVLAAGLRRRCPGDHWPVRGPIGQVGARLAG